MLLPLVKQVLSDDSDIDIDAGFSLYHPDHKNDADRDVLNIVVFRSWSSHLGNDSFFFYLFIYDGRNA